MNTEQRLQLIEQRIRTHLNPSKLNVIDDSHAHRGHAGAALGGGHFTVEISTDSFKDKNRVQCHRMVYDALGDLMEHEIHALSIKLI